MAGNQGGEEILFLRHLLLACGTNESRKLDEKLCAAARHERCVRRSIWLALQVILIAVAGICYTGVLLRDIPEETFDLLISIFARVAFGAGIGLIGFFGFWLIYWRQLGQMRNECRNFVTSILQSCLEQPGLVLSPLRQAEVIEYPARRQLLQE